MKHLKKFNEGTYQAHSTIPDANSKAADRLKIGVKKYGMDSKFYKEYRALCQTLRYEELDSFFAKWGIQAPTNEEISLESFKIFNEEIGNPNYPNPYKKPETITLTKEELLTFKEDVESQTGWCDTSYRICEFIGIDPTQGT